MKFRLKGSVMEKMLEREGWSCFNKKGIRKEIGDGDGDGAVLTRKGGF